MTTTTEATSQFTADAPPSAPASKPKKNLKKAKRASSGTKAARKPAKKADKAPQPERRNKKTEVLAMMKRSKGATLAEIIAATGWQKHTVRGFISILGKKGGEKIESFKNTAGERSYKLR